MSDEGAWWMATKEDSSEEVVTWRKWADKLPGEDLRVKQAWASRRGEGDGGSSLLDFTRKHKHFSERYGRL